MHSISKLSTPNNSTDTRAEQAMAVLASILVAAWVMAHVVAGKWLLLGGLPFSCSTLIYPLTFLIVHIVAEVHGPRQASMLISHGAIVSLLVVLLLGMASGVPTAATSPVDTVVFDQVFGGAWGTTVSSLLAYWIAQLSNLYLFEQLRENWGPKRLGFRSSGAAWCAQLINTVLFEVASASMRSIIGNSMQRPLLGLGMMDRQLIFSGLLVLLGTPLVYVGVHLAQQWIGLQGATSAANFRTRSPSRATGAYVLLVGIFIAFLLLTNVITVKYLRLGPVVLTAGALTYPFTFSLIDLLSELYGAKRAQLAVWVGLVMSLFMTVMVLFISWLPTCASSPVDQATFERIFGFTPGIVLGSMAAYCVAQFTDIYIFNWVRQITQGRYLWLRNNVSTLLSQGIDTLLFGLIAWVVWPALDWNKEIAPLPWAAWYAIMVNEYGFKVAFTLLNTPLVYLGVYTIRRWGKP
ncbi:MAG: queuosine precursor transporter [Roseivirga sp.]